MVTCLRAEIPHSGMQAWELANSHPPACGLKRPSARNSYGN